PTESLPNSLLRMYTFGKDCVDDQIRFFALTIISHRLGELFWMLPCAGKANDSAWYRPMTYDQETLTPYYYSGRLEDSLIQIEFTPSFRCGYFRLTFPEAASPVILLANRQEGELTTNAENAVTGV